MLLIVLVINHLLIISLILNQETFLALCVSMILFGIGLYLFLSKSLLEQLLKSDEQIQQMIKETIHELNTPVSTIQINTQMIKRKEQDGKNLKRLDRIDQACKNLLSIYKDMEYDIKKEVDNITKEEVKLHELVSKCISNFDDIKKDITITENIPSNIVLHIDKNGLKKVINNLLSNSIKYNKQNGFVKVSFKDGVLSIKDSGVGIDTKNLFKVLDRYYQEDFNHSGVGLGLNIVKEFCDKYKVKINIESSLKNGTTFYLDFSTL